MAADLKPIRTEADYEEALIEIERLWGGRRAARQKVIGWTYWRLSSTSMKPSFIPWIRQIQWKRSASAWNSKG